MCDKRKFFQHCPYCYSKVKIKAGRKLRFKDYYFSDKDDNEYAYQYKRIPVYKCKYCKNMFVVDMRDENVYKLTQIPELGIGYNKVPYENLKIEPC